MLADVKKNTWDAADFIGWLHLKTLQWFQIGSTGGKTFPDRLPKSGFGGHAATTRAHGELVARLELGPAVLDEIVLSAATIPKVYWSPKVN